MPSKLSLQSTLPLRDSAHKIPQIGFGVYLSPGEVCAKSCLKALQAGYRHIDTAQCYENEEQVGQALRECGIPRSEIYVTTKILASGAGKDDAAAYASVKNSVTKIAGKDGYVDLFLIHSPNTGLEERKRMWRALEKAKEAGIVRDIGVSNHGPRQIEEMKQFAKVYPPAVNQIELHPWCQQREAVQFCESQDILVEAYCPIVRNQKADDKTLVSIAEKHKTSPNQVLVRYCLQKNWVPLPKSDTPSRIEANADVYGFELDGEDMEALDALDQGAAGAIVEAVPV